MDAYIPDSIPNTETTVYRNKKTVIRIRPSNASTSGVYLTMYCKIKGKLKFLTPEKILIGAMIHLILLQIQLNLSQKTLPSDIMLL